MKKILLVGVLACSFLLPAGVFAAEVALKIGYVNSRKVLNEYDKTKIFNKELEKKDSEVMGVIEERTKEVRKLRDDIELLSDKSKAKRQPELRDKIQELDEFRKTKIGELMRWRDENIMEIRNNILEIISSYAEKHDYDMIADETAYVYIDNKYDISDDVIAQLNEEDGSKKRNKR
jgi:Skp family chaperone for outer membrane proteins